MSPTIWGPHAWFLLHSISMALPNKIPKETQKNLIDFMESFGGLIPCNICKINYKRHLLKDMSPLKDNIQTRQLFAKWLIDLHNIVNKETGKPEMCYEAVVEKYDKIYNKRKETNHVCKCIVLIGVILIIYYIIKNYRK
jgi:hypothetical protein